MSIDSITPLLFLLHVCARVGHRYIELFLKDDITGAAPMMQPRGGGQMGGASRGGAMGQRYPPPQQQSQPTTWNDPRTQVD